MEVQARNHKGQAVLLKDSFLVRRRTHSPGQLLSLVSDSFLATKGFRHYADIAEHIAMAAS